MYDLRIGLASLSVLSDLMEKAPFFPGIESARTEGKAAVTLSTVARDVGHTVL